MVKEAELTVKKSELQAHKYKSTEIKTLMIDGQCWFYAVDVAKCLIAGSHTAKAIFRVLGKGTPEMKLVNLTWILPQNPNWSKTAYFISKKGIDELAEKGGKPEEARKFQLWVNRLMELSDDDGMVFGTDDTILNTGSATGTSGADSAHHSTSALQVFTGKDFVVRTVIDADGTVWFVAKDIAQALEYPESSLNQVNNLFKSVPEMWSAHKQIMVSSENGVIQGREMLCLTEQGVYFFLGRSDKPKALPYQMWIAGDVVPSIHATGMYMTPQAKATTEAYEKRLQDQIRDLTAEIRELRRDVAIKTSEQSGEVRITDPAKLRLKATITIGQLAIVLNATESPAKNLIERDDLFTWLRNHDYLSSDPADYNQPTPTACWSAFFSKRLTHYEDPETGEDVPYWQAVCTNKGMRYLMNLRKTGEEFLPLEELELTVLREMRVEEQLKIRQVRKKAMSC